MTDTSTESTKDFQHKMIKDFEDLLKEILKPINVNYLDRRPISDEEKFVLRYGANIYTRVAFSSGKSRTITIKELERLKDKKWPT